MRRNFPQKLLRYASTSLAITILSCTAWGSWSMITPAIAVTPQQKEASLKQSQRRWIEIDLSSQRLYAWQGNRQVYAVVVSTGKAATPTRTGVFNIHRKLVEDRMRGDGYDIPDVPHAMYYSGGYAIHGTYWHNNFGTPMSHGCVNVATDHARWLFNWASTGTPVVIHQ